MIRHNTRIVLHSISLLSETQFVDRELDIVRRVRQISIKIYYIFLFLLMSFILHIIIICTNIRRRVYA